MKLFDSFVIKRKKTELLNNKTNPVGGVDTRSDQVGGMNVIFSKMTLKKKVVLC